MTICRHRNDGGPASTPVITASDLVIGHDGRPATAPISFYARSGDSICLVGPSGAGKTTLLRMIAGLAQPLEGKLTAPAALSAVFQDTRLIDGLDAVDNVAIFAAPGIGQAAARALLGEILPADVLDRPVRDLSGGQRRRVEIARALAAPGTAILLDEPFTGLDGGARDRAVACIERHRGARAIILTAHDLDEATTLHAAPTVLEPTQLSA